MRNYTRLLLTVFAATCILAASVSTASAKRIEISNQRIRSTWTSLRFTNNVGGGVEVRCPVTIEGSFHSKTISKVCGQLVGLITRAHLGPRRENCTFAGGATEVRILNGGSQFGEDPTQSLPWRILYVSFTGILPNITRVRLKLLGTAFLLTAFSVNCLYKSNETNPAFGEIIANERTGLVTELEADRTRSIPKSSGGMLCPSAGFFEGNARVTELETANAITIKLVQ